MLDSAAFTNLRRGRCERHIVPLTQRNSSVSGETFSRGATGQTKAGMSGDTSARLKGSLLSRYTLQW